MVQRINFIEKGTFALTYKKMLLITALWAGLCLGIFIIISGYGWWLGKTLEKQRVNLNQLNARKDRTMALIEATKVEKVAPDVKYLSEIYDYFPTWSKVMAALSKNMPSQIWLTSISTQYLSKDSMIRKVEVGGMGENTSSIAKFVKNLNDTHLFRNMILSKSDRVQDDHRSKGYSFIILGEIKFGERKWD